MPFNGTGRELHSSEDHREESVYCTQCGTIYVKNFPRSCPACTLAERQEKIIEQIDQVERDLDVIDGGF
ncbi:hypothetical protein [Halalkalicoccus sp. NIPERK01]|uniref:hypothetical protein n=1 Tax=Halalkalicoccus sp. NIPERK01 TaxID=3053469 RepID=UPI00256F041C|nr:hypothetical protein [Halalkalicoccus sp. NIPERK01]MDL5361331.1 hypothetical protein [Halalkalicoccus sp. NIPERK01]